MQPLCGIPVWVMSASLHRGKHIIRNERPACLTLCVHVFCNPRFAAKVTQVLQVTQKMQGAHLLILCYVSAQCILSLMLLPWGETSAIVMWGSAQAQPSLFFGVTPQAGALLYIDRALQIQVIADPSGWSPYI